MLARELSELLEGTADAAFAVDGQGLIRTWNASAEKLFGHPAGSVLGKPCAQLIQGSTVLGTEICCETCDVIRCAEGGRKIPNFDLAARTRSGRRIWINVSILVLNARRRGGAFAIHFARDISQRKSAEEMTRKMLEVAKRLVSASEGRGADPNLPPVAPVTEREIRVLRLLADGKTPDQVARELGISPQTVRNHLHHINQKLHTHNRLEAVTHALKRGLI